MIPTDLALISSDQLLPYLYAAAAVMLVVYGFLMLRRRQGAGSAPPATAVSSGPAERPWMLQAAFERAPYGIGFVNGEGQWLDANRRLLATLGYTKTELANIPLRLLTHPEDRKREATLFAEMRAGKRAGYAMSKRLQRKGGDFRTHRVHMLRVAETPQAVFQCTLEYEGQHGSEIETISAALEPVQQTAAILCDTTGTITGWNAGAERIFGIPAHDAIGTSWIKLHATETKESLTRLVASSAREGFARSLNTRHRKDGSTVVVSGVLVADLLRGDASGFLEICHAEEAVADAPAPTPAAEWKKIDGPGVRDALMASARSFSTGTLRVRSGAREKRFLFDQGQLIAATSDRGDRRVGQLLVDAGVIDEGQLRLALDSSRSSGESFGSSIVTHGPATDDDVADVIRTKAREEIADAVAWPSAEWIFEDSLPQTAPMVSVAIDVRSLLEEDGPSVVARMSAKKKTYHLRGCPSAQQIPAADRIGFQTAPEAELQGYRPCPRCVSS